ncbi:MAG: hypothetical protein ACD_45C00316G0003 [uncultured bacterium]|nr:MAG: hypothetical protein ACD_45C00316G0003 [uncultured bacterium]
MMKIPSERLMYFISLVIIALLLSATFYLEKYDGFIPCPLCILQRITFGILGVLFFVGMLLPNIKLARLLISILAGLFSLFGIYLSGRQVWLQHLPADPNADCGVSLQYLIKALPFDQAIARIMQGTAECSQTGWEFLHLSLADWSLLCFIVFFGVCLLQLSRALRQ